MSKIVVIPNSENMISCLSDEYILLGIEGYSVNTLSISLNKLEKLLNDNQKVFISLNKNFDNSELSSLEKLLQKLDTYKILGIFYYDVAVVNIASRLNLKTKLIWAAEHLTTNYFTINYWFNHGVQGTFLSNELTIDEIIQIRNNTQSLLFVQLFGYLPMYVSRRHAIKNYLKYFGLNNSYKTYELFKEDKTYSIVDSADGTVIYSDFILNGLHEYLKLRDTIDYIIINGYQIENDKLLRVVDIFKKVNHENVDALNKEICQQFANVATGFLHEKTIYRVKKNDK